MHIQQNKMLHKTKHLKIAFVTDIHLSEPGLEKLSQFLTQHYNTQQKFDYCFIGGDTANCNHDKMNHDEQQMWEATLKVHRKIKDIFCCKVFFVPGNHDCKRFFLKNTQNANQNAYGSVEGVFYNMHGRKLEISEGLELVGFGGSAPGYVDGEQVWSGYPFKNDKQLTVEWQKTELQKQKWSSTSQKILLTHCGPSLSQTTLDRSQYPSRTVTTGSSFLNKFYEDKQIICWLHGHTHNGSNNSKINGIQVMNPGPLCYFQFMHFQVVKGNGIWRLAKKVFHAL